MKYELAVKLKAGDLIETHFGPRRSLGHGVVVSGLKTARGFRYGVVGVRRVGLTPAGHRWPVVQRRWWELESPPDPVDANVYADWLEDNDEPRAADKLRRAFPLGPAKEAV